MELLIALLHVGHFIVDTGLLRFARSGNQEFTDELSRWTFQEKSVLKVFDHRHHKDGETQKLETYRIKDNIVSSSQ
jgi:oligosaccharyltransferase complex subunit beta